MTKVDDNNNMAQQHQNRNDIYTTIVCLIIIALGAYFLKTDFSFFSSGRDIQLSEIIGRIDKVKSEVRHRSTKNIFWINSFEKDVLTFGDSVFVGSDSQTEIKFSDGSKIKIGPNSLVKFRMDDKKIKLSLQYGTIKSDRLPMGFILDDCGQSLEIASDSGDIEIGKKNACGKIKVKSKTGSVTINKKSVESDGSFQSRKSLAKLFEKPPEQIITPSEVLTPEPNTVTDYKLALPPQLISEKTNYLVSKKNPLVLRWQYADHAKEYVVEYSSMPDFNEKVEQRSMQNESLVQSIQSDKIFYRLKSVSENNSESAYSQVGEVNIRYPTIRLKEPKQNYDYFARNSKDQGKEKEFKINWTEVPNAKKYVVQINDGSNVQAPKRIVSRKPASIIKIPKSGRYNYKVTAYDAQNRQISSTTDSGEIVYNRIFDLVTPYIENSVESMSYYFQKGLGKFIWLKWNTEQNANRYKVEIAKDKEFTQVYKAYITKNKKMLLKDNFPQGQYFWRVRSEVNEDSKNQVSDWSTSALIEIKSGQEVKSEK